MKQQQYRDFLKSKKDIFVDSGFDIDHDRINPILKEHQKKAVIWHLKKGKSYNGFDVGLGKTPVQLEFSRIIHEEFDKPVLILAPLLVSYQLKKDAIDIFEIPKDMIKICKTQDDVINGINITNYEKIDHFDPDKFIAICLDESSILKNFTGKFKTKLIEFGKNIQYRLTLSATASPNDFTEIGNQSEFLGVKKYFEMLSMFFLNDSGDTTNTWRLKSHAKKDFFTWLSSWALLIQKPSDIGCSDDGYILPENNIIEYCYDNDHDSFFPQIYKPVSLSEIRKINRETLNDRCNVAADIINNSDETFLCWCFLNDESKLLKSLIKDSVEIKGADSEKHKEETLLKFLNGEIKCLITKPSIAGFGLNFQYVCHNAVFVGMNYSFEMYYQALKRIFRFGQKHITNCFIIYSKREGNVIQIIKNKILKFLKMHHEMKKYINSEIEFEKCFIEKEKHDFIEIQFPKFIKE